MARIAPGVSSASGTPPGNGVHEYGAELALRYYLEERAMAHDEKLKKPPFKCGPEENKKAWAAITEEFFAGIDLVPPCSP